MAQDFWAASGYRLLERRDGELVATDAWLAAFLEREELAPPADAGPRERALHDRLKRDPRAPVDDATLRAVEDADARENWSLFVAFRDLVLAHPTLEAAYAALFAEASVPVAAPFVDALACVLLRHVLDGTEDAWSCRAGELFFRLQRVSSEEGRVLCADAATIETYAATGGFGNVGRLLRQQNVPTAAVKMDILSAENAPLYFLRDELFGFVLDLSARGPGATALARVLERWVAHMAGTAVTIEPVERIHDERWRWHVGLDAESTALLNALYRGEPVDEEALARLVSLFALRFRDERAVSAGMRGRPVYLGLACRPDRTLKLKPQNLLGNLPLASRPAATRVE